MIIDVILLVGVIYKSTQVPAPQYFAATPDGRIIQQHPLTDPVLSDAQVLAWVSNVTQALYRMDYVHWQDQLQLVANYFTPAGWRNYVTALKASNNLNALTQFKMVTKVQLTGTNHNSKRCCRKSLFMDCKGASISTVSESFTSNDFTIIKYYLYYFKSTGKR